MMFNAGAVIGALLGGRIADRYGFHAVYFVAAGLFVLSTAAVHIHLAAAARSS